jgi:hypothetical protein
LVIARAACVFAVDGLRVEERARSDRLRRAQADTLGTPRRRYSPMTRLLVKGMGLVYGRSGSFAKYQVLELVARVPYQSSGWRRGDTRLQAGEETPRHLPGNVSGTR